MPATDPEDGESAARIVAVAVNALRSFQPVGGKEAAVVLRVDDASAQLVRGDGSFATLDLTAVEWARPFEDIDTRGAPPTKVSDVLASGDVVRILPLETPKEESTEAAPASWRLTQIPEIQGAIVSLDPDTGRILALTGGYDFSLNQYNHAIQAARQPGSGFKPFVYAAALANGVTPATVYMDAPLVFDDDNLETEYRPDNDNNRYNGPTRLREALYRSINLVSMRVLLDVEAGPVIDYAREFGFDPATFPRNTQLAIGGGTMAVTPMQMATAYAVLANGGFKVTPHIIDSMRDRDGSNVFTARHPVVCRECELIAPREEEIAEETSEEAAATVGADQEDEEAGPATDEPDDAGEEEMLVAEPGDRCPRGLHHDEHAQGCDQAWHRAKGSGAGAQRHRRKNRYDE